MKLMNLSQLIALCFFASYFLSIFIACGRISRSIRVAARSKADELKLTTRLKVKIGLFLGLAFGSFVHIGYYILKYLECSFHEYEESVGVTASQIRLATVLERVLPWLQNSSLFEEAWLKATQKSANWWWTEQICLFTVGAWTIFLVVEGKRRQIKYLPFYMLLGQMVATSVASNLFYATVLLSPLSASPSRTRSAIFTRTTKWLWLPVIVGLVTTTMLPHTSSSTFLINLLVMHAVLFIPSLDSIKSVEVAEVSNAVFTKSNPPIKEPGVALLSALCMVISVVLRWRTTTSVISSDEFDYSRTEYVDMTANPRFPLDLVRLEWKILYETPAQSMFGWDIVWCSISLVVWVLMREKEDDGIWTYDEFRNQEKDGNETEEDTLLNGVDAQDNCEDHDVQALSKNDRPPFEEPEPDGEIRSEKTPPPIAQASWTRAFMFKVLYAVLATPFASIGVTGPYVLRPSEPEYVPISEW